MEVDGSPQSGSLDCSLERRLDARNRLQSCCEVHGSAARRLRASVLQMGHKEIAIPSDNAVWPRIASSCLRISMSCFVASVSLAPAISISIARTIARACAGGTAAFSRTSSKACCTGTEPHFTYLTLGDSRDSVNNLIHGRVGSTNRSGRAVTRGAIYKECPMKCRRCGESLR